MELNILISTLSFPPAMKSKHDWQFSLSLPKLKVLPFNCSGVCCKRNSFFFLTFYVLIVVLCSRYISVLFHLNFETFKWNKWITKSHINTYFIKPQTNAPRYICLSVKTKKKKKCVKNIMWKNFTVHYSMCTSGKWELKWIRRKTGRCEWKWMILSSLFFHAFGRIAPIFGENLYWKK